MILFDEIEKAHPDVMNILLQILDDGHITDAHGRRVNFSNAILIMTSNAGSEQKGAGAMGFSRESNEQSKEKAMRALKEFLRPEFLNRLDDVICFNHLTLENTVQIAHILLGELRGSMKEKGMTLCWDEDAARVLAQSSYSEAYGARNLRRAIERDVEDKIVDELIAREGSATAVQLSEKDGKLLLDVS